MNVIPIVPMSQVRAPGLAAYATNGARSRGRLFKERDCTMRSPFQRDRDRIVHATSFRRLTYKTQVFLFHEGDHFRTRLTHTIEVAQIARALARLLHLDEDLAEALALAHDLGHPPFGHAGERALDEALRDLGGFDHNAQSLKVVTALEHKYAAFDGLNLTWETLEGLVKHNGPLLGDKAGPDGCAAPVPCAISAFNRRYDLELDKFASAEAQVAAIADDIAYNNHDIDDGLRAGLIDLDQLADVPLAGPFVQEVRRLHPGLESQKVIYEVNRRLITAMIDDVGSEAHRRIGALSPKSAEDIRNAPRAVVAFSDNMASELDELRRFLFARVYRHTRVMRVMTNAEQIVRDLFAKFMADQFYLPAEWSSQLTDQATRQQKGALIGDYVAGMTDRYAIDEHLRLFDLTPELS